MEREARYYDGNSTHIGMGWWWVFSRALAFLSILLMIAWSGFSSGDEKRSYHVQANGQPIWRSSSAKQPLINEPQLLQIMKQASLFMEGQLYTTPETPRKTVKSVTLSFEDSISVPLVTIQSNIYMSSKYTIMGNFEGNHSTVELERAIYTAMAHVWLWNGKGNAPLGLMGAMTNLLTSFALGLEARNYTFAEVVTSTHSHATIEDEGGQQQWAWSLWDSYHEELLPLTTSFLAFCEGAKPGFLSALNSKLEHGWNQSYFQDLLNRTVDDLWEDFKALKLHSTIQ